MWPTLWEPVVGVAVVWLVAGLALRSARRGGIVASITAIAALNAGRVTGGAPGALAIVVVGVVVLGAILLAWRLPRTAVLPLTTVLNVLAVTAVLLAVPPVRQHLGPGRSFRAPPRRRRLQLDGDAGGLAGRDIWYIIPDRYPRADTLASVFDYDNTPFLSHLEDLGFQVAERSLANYPKTAHSLSPRRGTWPRSRTWSPTRRPTAASGSRCTRCCATTGSATSSPTSATSTSSSAPGGRRPRPRRPPDRVLRADTNSEFETVWRTQTLWPALAGTDDSDEGDLSLRERNRRYSSYQLDELDRLAQARSTRPRFIQAHITVPHEPYVFDADGSSSPPSRPPPAPGRRTSPTRSRTSTAG